jgi:hypothetical protein
VHTFSKEDKLWNGRQNTDFNRCSPYRYSAEKGTWNSTLSILPSTGCGRNAHKFSEMSSACGEIKPAVLFTPRINSTAYDTMTSTQRLSSLNEMQLKPIYLKIENSRLQEDFCHSFFLFLTPCRCAGLNSLTVMLTALSDKSWEFSHILFPFRL